MLEVNGFDEILELLLQNIADEKCGHASYVSNEDDITEILKLVNISTDAKPELINFDNSTGGYYVFELDCDEDNELSYSIWAASDEYGIFNTNYGLCLVDENIPKKFEDDYKEYGKDDDNYIEPIRVRICHEENTHNCEFCNIPDCIERDLTSGASESVKIDTADGGCRYTGFTKTWKKDDSYFSYSYHSNIEDDVIDVMEKFGIDLP